MKKSLLTRAVKAVITNESGEILLLQRNPRISHQDNWDLPGGLVETGENYKNALIREVKEELNLTIAVIKQAGKWQFIRLRDQQLINVKTTTALLLMVIFTSAKNISPTSGLT